MYFYKNSSLINPPPTGYSYPLPLTITSGVLNALFGIVNPGDSVSNIYIYPLANGGTGQNRATGATGATGQNGATGQTGSTGATGQTGSTGVTGPAGQNGQNGQNGINGTPGTDGATGPTGPTGATGTFNSGDNIVANTVTAITSMTSPTIIATGANGSITATGANGSITATSISAGTITTTSDYRIKENITPLDETYTTDYLNPVAYLNTKMNKNDIGLIAHEVQKLYPSLVTGEKDGLNLQTLNYSGLIPILINEIKLLKTNFSSKIQMLEEKIEKMEAQISYGK